MPKSRASYGTHGGIAPFGYKWIAGRLVLDPTEASLRMLIFELFLKHRRKKTVAKAMNDLCHRTRNGSPFSDTTIARLLSDPIVVGVQGTNADHLSIEPLIGKDVWETAQILLGDRPTKQTLHLFTGVVSCDCGRKMSISSGSSKYACRACRRKIGELDLEEILHTKLADKSIFQTSELFDQWDELPAKDRRLLVEHICDRIVVGKDSITLEIGYSAEAPDRSKPQELEGEDTNRNAQSGDEPLMSEAESAKFLGVSKMTLLRKRRTAEISFFRVGSRVLYSKQKHLLPYLSKNENKDR